ncbi:MAG: hypothetical protein J6J13_04010 [Clostridia bacterium]|nr:hypothetical protein [Clostridia bacterium]
MPKGIKIKFVSIALVAIIMTFITQSTLSYYTTVGKATNVVTSGNIRFMINERTDSGTEFPKEGVYIMPGDIVSKQVSITSDCSHPFYLRVKLVYGINSSELPYEDCFKLNIDENNWQLHDGWYYYKGIVNPFDSTPNVFSHVEIVGSKVDNSYIGKTLTLTVKADAVQSENNPVEGTDTYKALGWPREDGV